MHRANHTGMLDLRGTLGNFCFLETALLFISAAAGIISCLKLLSRFQEELMPRKMSAQSKVLIGGNRK